MAESENVTGMGVHLKVSSIESSRAFYEEYLGFRPIFAYGDSGFLETIPPGVPTAPEKYHGVTYEAGGTKFEIADGHIAVKDLSVFSKAIDSPKISAMVNVKSLVPYLGNSAESHYPICHYYWGTIEMVVRDPDGWIILLIAPYSESEYNEVSKYRAVETISPGK